MVFNENLTATTSAVNASRGSVVCTASESMTTELFSAHKLMGCGGRNDLFTGTVQGLLACKVKCSEAPFCVSFEFFSTHALYGDNYCQTSSTCLVSLAVTQSDRDLYVKHPKASVRMGFGAGGINTAATARAAGWTLSTTAYRNGHYVGVYPDGVWLEESCAAGSNEFPYTYEYPCSCCNGTGSRYRFWGAGNPSASMTIALPAGYNTVTVRVKPAAYCIGTACVDSTGSVLL